jgi:hypothetical protein
MSDPKVCEERVMSNFPRHLAFWGNRPVLEEKLRRNRTAAPDGLILNIDCSGIPLEAAAASMRFFATELMPDVRRWLEHPG